MRIILDGMGGDNAPEEIVKGAVEAAKEIEDEIIIVGKANTKANRSASHLRRKSSPWRTVRSKRSVTRRTPRS